MRSLALRLGLEPVHRAGPSLTLGGTRVELVLQDDRRGLAVDAGPPGSALVAGRWPPGPATFHRADALLGEMTGQALVTIPDRRSNGWPDRLHPGPGGPCLAPLVA